MHTDTLYMHSRLYDSVYIDNWHYIEHKADTLWVRDVSTCYKYRIVHDTVRVVRVDSIPVIREVEVVRPVEHVPWWSKALSYVLVLVLVVVGLRFGFRLH